MAKAAAKKVTKTKTVPYDVAEQLRTPVERAVYRCLARRGSRSPLESHAYSGSSYTPVRLEPQLIFSNQ